MNLSREHITLVLGINLPLNESFNDLNKELKTNVLYEQMLYESFLDSIKKYAGEKWDEAINAIKDWKDAAVVLGKVISDPQILQNFSDNLWKTFQAKTNLLDKLKELLNRLKLNSYIPKIEALVKKITSLQGWKKFLTVISITSITKYILDKLSNLSSEGLEKWITSYFSEEGLSKLTDKLTDFTSYIGWLQPIIKGTEILYDVLRPTIEKFKFAFGLKSQTTENKMKKSQLKQIIKEEIKKTINEVESSKQNDTIQGSFRADIFKKLMGTSFDPTKFNSAMTKLKNNQSRSITDNAFLGDVVRALMYTDDNTMLNSVFNYLKTLKTKPKT